jgi:pimeloyl-ACP methyl ester carboxylesterase
LAKLARRVLVLLLLCGSALFLLPAEKTPPTGQWLSRAGLEPQVIRLGRFDVRYVRKGQGPSVILIHGLASSIYTWADVIGPLSLKFDVIALDLPGFGASSQPADLSFDDYGKTLVGLMNALGVEKAHFIGNSMGGAASLFMAARERDRVDHVVILDSAGFNLKPGERPFLVRLLASRTAAALAERLPVKRLLTRLFLRRLIEDETRITDERINEYVAPLLRPGAMASARSLLLSRFDEGFVADLGGIRAKTLVLWGRFDPWLPESHADRFVAEIKGARKVVLETGHMPQEEKPAEVARLIAEFLIS